MVSKFSHAKQLTALILSVCFAAAALPAQAAPAADLSLAQQTIRFYIDPAILPDMAFARMVLPKYVSDMNAVLAKNTRRQLVFDPATGIIATSTQPQSDSAPSPMPTEGFEIWAHVTRSTYVMSYGGYAGIDTSGAGVLAGLYWTKLYDPDNLAPGNDVLDYSIQLDHMLHELGHVFGAAIGEYYSLGSVTDTTGAAPLLNINVNNRSDAYWSDKPDFMVDPLLRLTHTETRAQYVSKVQYSSLTAAIINTDYRNGIASFKDYTVQVLDLNGQPMPDANVKVWSVVARPPYGSALSFDGQTDVNGQVTLDWGGAGSPHNQGNLLRLIKIYKDGIAIAQPRYVSIFDMDIAKLVNNAGSFTVTIQETNQAPTDITLTGASLDENQPADSTIGSLLAVDPDAGSSASFALCGGTDDASFQISGADLLSAAEFDYELKNSYSVCVQADDGRGGSFQKSLVIAVNDLPDTTRVTFNSVGANDGWVLESARGSNTGASFDAASTTSRLGNDAANRRYRSVLAFNTVSLPDNAVITKVTLKIKRQGSVGADPFAAFKSLTVDIGKPFIGTTAGLQKVDFQAQAGQASAGMFGKKPDAKGWYSASLQSSALDLLNLQGATQFRLRFSAAVNTGANYLAFFSGNAAQANRPVLVVEYEVP